MKGISRAASVEDFRLAAHRRLPRVLFEYIDGGAYSEETLRRNLQDFQRLVLRQRVLRDMTELDTATEVFGQRLGMPLILGPVGMAGMYARRGEVQAAKAAQAASIPFCLSTVGICSVEECAEAVEAPWFQLYVLKDRGYMRELIHRARSAGSPVLVLTVDLPVPGARYRDVRSGFRGLTGLAAMWNRLRDGLLHPAWVWDVWVNGRPHVLGNVAGAIQQGASQADFLTWISHNFDRSVTWNDIEWIRAEWPGPIVVKGILDPEDACEAIRVGFEGIVVSNHGGRQLDGVRSSVSALQVISDVVGGRAELLLDGGVRSGLDMLKAVALGASACLIGRPWAYALGAGGSVAVTQMLSTLKSELEVAMVLTGCNSIRGDVASVLDRLNSEY